MWMARPSASLSIDSRDADLMHDSSSHGRRCQRRKGRMTSWSASMCSSTFPTLSRRHADSIGCLRDGGVVVQTGGFVDEGHHPCHLEEGVHRFGGLKWDIHLAGLGLRGEGPNLLVKVQGPVRTAQRLRFWIWRATGLWVTRVSR